MGVLYQYLMYYPVPFAVKVFYKHFKSQPEFFTKEKIESSRDMGGHLIFLEFSKMLKNFQKFNENLKISDLGEKHLKSIRNIREELLVLFSIILKKKMLVFNREIDRPRMNSSFEILEDNFLNPLAQISHEKTYERLE